VASVISTASRNELRLDTDGACMLKSLCDLISQCTKGVANPLTMIALNFEAVILNGATCTALRFEAAEKFGQVVTFRT